MKSNDTDTGTDLCYRCGYDLRATPNDRPCPECGLLAARSRRPSDELRHTRPAWLWSLAAGALLMLASMVGAVAWWGGLAALRQSDLHYTLRATFRITPQMLVAGTDWGLAGIAGIFIVAIFLLTRAEKYPPADRADRWLRWGLRIAAFTPLAAVVLEIFYLNWGIHSVLRSYNGSSNWTFYSPYSTRSAPIMVFFAPHRVPWLAMAAFYVATLGTAPLPVLLFLRLRGLAKRARSAQLAEHCLIVGIGTAAAILYFTVYSEFTSRATKWGWGQYWSTNSETSLWLTTILGTIALLFGGWAVILLVRFTLSFVAATAAIRREQPPPAPPAPREPNIAYAAIAEAGQDLCYRCGYDLRATPDDRPCPECGLLAVRSRRPSDELRHTRPRWLLGLAAGTVIVTASIGLGAVWWPIAIEIADFNGWYYGPASDRLPMWGFAAMASLFFVGIFLLSRPEGYPPADRADRKLRLFLRLAALVPILAIALAITSTEIRLYMGNQVQQYNSWSTLTGNTTGYYSYHTVLPFMVDTLSPILFLLAFLIATIGTVPVPLLLFRHLRGLAKRARSAHLAEHCTIVAIGSAASLVYVAAAIELFDNASHLGLPEHWLDRSNSALALMALLGVAAGLFLLWSIYLLVRFTISFIAAAYAIRHS